MDRDDFGRDGKTYNVDTLLSGYDYGIADYSQSYNIETVVQNLLRDLKPIAAKYDDIIIIAHSQGGNIAKRILIESEIEIPDLVTRVKAVIFLSTPSNGSEVAAEASRYIYSDPQLRDLGPAQDNAYLTQLNKKWADFLNVDKAKRPAIHCAFETLSTPVPNSWFGWLPGALPSLLIVKSGEIDKNCDGTDEPKKFAKDHLTIAEPRDPNDVVYAWVRTLILDLASSGRLQCLTLTYKNSSGDHCVVAGTADSFTSELEPGDTICSFCPSMLKTPRGDFVMGSDPNFLAKMNREHGADQPKIADEAPNRNITFKNYFVMSQNDITRVQFRAFAADMKIDGVTYLANGDCNYWDSDKNAAVAEKGSFERPPRMQQAGDTDPAVCVSWNDAVLYAKWLSKKTDRKYRLPTEAEWEYAARAGATSAYWWGDEPDKDKANCYDCSGSGQYSGTSPTGRFPSNSWQLNDMAGNVLQWVQDNYHSGYYGAPKDGAAWVDDATKDHVARGGSWELSELYLYSARRWIYPPNFRSNALGFRVVRELN